MKDFLEKRMWLTDADFMYLFNLNENEYSFNNISNIKNGSKKKFLFKTNNGEKKNFELTNEEFIKKVNEKFFSNICHLLLTVPKEGNNDYAQIIYLQKDEQYDE